MEGLSGDCRLFAEELLRCHARPGPDNSSTPVCELREDAGDRMDTSTVHSLFLSVIGVTVLLAVVLNLVVILTIAFNKKLHTMVNYLTSLLCFNQLVWVIFPVIEIKLNEFLSPGLCALRHHVLQISTSADFGLIVTITLLRYLMVVRNHSYPARCQNMLFFTGIALLPFIFRVLMFSRADNGLCGHFLAETPDGYAINTVPTRHRQLRTLIILLIEHIVGLCALAFCYANILAKTCASEKRMAVHATEFARSQSVRGKIRVQAPDGEVQQGPSSSAAHRREDSILLRVPKLRLSKISHGPGRRGPDSPTLPKTDAMEATVPETCRSEPPTPPPGGAQGVSRVTRGVLLSVRELAPASTSRSPSEDAGSRCPNAVTASRPPPPRTGGRIDIVATMSMVAFFITFMASFLPYLLLIHYEKERELKCVLMPDTRMYIMMVAIASGGITAVFNPLVCVVFSRDFRNSFCQMGRRCSRWICGKV